MPSELSLAVVGALFDNTRRRGKPPPRPADHVPEVRKMVGGSPDAWDGVDYIPPDDVS